MKRMFFIALAINSSIGALAFHAGDGSWANPKNHFNYFDNCNADMVFLQRDTVIPIKVQLEKTSFNDIAILFISDTARQTADLESIFSKGYSELMKYARENHLKTRKFLGWYYTVESPWIMDIALETDKLPSELTGRIKSRIEKGGEVLIAHMWGPYSQLSQAYIQIQNWLQQNKRIARGIPFEIYLNDPMTVKDPLEIQTDIYQPLQ